MAQNKMVRPIAEFPVFGEHSDIDDEEEVQVGLPITPATTQHHNMHRPTAIADLGNSTKLWFLIGRGNTGKTMLIRYLGEAVYAAGRQVVLADMDRTNATLSSYFDGVQRPPDADEATVTKWLERLLTFLMKNKVGAFVDLGGGDTTLRRLVAEVPGLVDMLTSAGAAPVATYMTGPRPDDLAPLAMLEAAGFQPAATAIVLNEGLIEVPLLRDEAFARLTRHSAFKGAIVRGAVPLWMPRLLPSAEVEARRIQFAMARDGVMPEGRRQAPLGAFDRARVRAWMTAMEAELGIIRSWLP
jgi:hypothetical protein